MATTTAPAPKLTKTRRNALATWAGREENAYSYQAFGKATYWLVENGLAEECPNGHGGQTWRPTAAGLAALGQ